MFHRRKTYQLDTKAANDALQNILAECEKPPCSTPIDKILIKQNARTKDFDTLLTIITYLLVFTILIPLLFLFF